MTFSNMCQEQPLLSVVVPSLDADVELARCLYSIDLALGGGAAYEIVLVVPARIAAEVTKAHPNARVCIEKRRGIYSAMNDGAAASRGRYLYFIGKDDILLPPIKDALSILANDGAVDALFCDVYWGTRGIYSGRPSRWRILGRNLCHQGIVYSRSAFARCGPYVRAMRVQADHFLNIRILWQEGSAVAYLNKPIVWYSGSGFSTLVRDPVFWRLYPNILDRYVGTWALWLLIAYRRLRGR